MLAFVASFVTKMPLMIEKRNAGRIARVQDRALFPALHHMLNTTQYFAKLVKIKWFRKSRPSRFFGTELYRYTWPFPERQMNGLSIRSSRNFLMTHWSIDPPYPLIIQETLHIVLPKDAFVKPTDLVLGYDKVRES